MHRAVFLSVGLALLACCDSVSVSTKAFIFSYNVVGNGQGLNPGEPGQVLAVQNIQEDFPDYRPPLTADGAFAPPPPPPAPTTSQPSQTLPTGPYQPIFATGLFPPFLPYYHGFSYISYVTPTSQFFVMFV